MEKLLIYIVQLECLYCNPEQRHNCENVNYHSCAVELRWSQSFTDDRTIITRVLILKHDLSKGSALFNSTLANEHFHSY